jgi:thiamine-monophosphate kinase
MSEKRTELSELGEFGLISRLAETIQVNNQTTIKGIGDDAAVIDAGSHFGLLAADMLMEGIHFDLSYMPLQHLGYKAISVNVSDIAAMNGKPEQVTVSLGLSNRFSVEAIEALYDGMRAAAKAFGVDIVGGDTTASKSGLVISISIFGTVEKEKVCYRSGAGNNDILCVTGDLGAAFMGLQVLERERQTYLANPNAQPQLEEYQYVVQRQLKPIARMDIIHELAEFGVVPTAMIDISDGLASECLHLSKNSGVGIQIYEDKLPYDRQTYETAVEFNIDPITATLNGGEDYELLFTIAMEDFDKIKANPNFSIIGHMTQESEGIHLVTRANTKIPLKARGWDPITE